MPRKADGRGKIRAELEGVLLELDDMDGCIAMVAMRIDQAIRRSGMRELLVPALDELKRMGRSMNCARSQAQSAMDRLKE